VHMIQELLDIETMESGSLGITPAQMSLSAALEKAIEAVSGPAQLKQITIEPHVVDAEIVADEDRLVQVVINLLTNAIKFSPENSVIKVESVSNSKDIEVKVVDQGRGVPPAHQQTIFERFRQIDASDSKEKGGVGLGLALCKAIVEQHGGTIGVESEDGHGSTFWFRLPVKSTSSADNA
jgi:signal transduction histidine kinase